MALLLSNQAAETGKSVHLPTLKNYSKIMNTNQSDRITETLATNTDATKSKPDKKITSESKEFQRLENQNTLLVKTKVLSILLQQKLWIKNIYGKYYVVNASNSRWPLKEHPDGSPAVTASCALAICSASAPRSLKHDQFIVPIIKILIAEASKGMHFQKSFDKALDDCTKIIPCENDWVDAQAVHSFLGEVMPFILWSCCILESLVMYGPQNDSMPPPPVSVGGGTPLYLNSSVAFRAILSSQTLRGSLLREDFLPMDSLWHASLTDPSSGKETMPMSEQFFCNQKSSTPNELSI